MKRRMIKEVRCPKCGKLLGRFDGIGEIKCNRCKMVVKINTTERQ